MEEKVGQGIHYKEICYEDGQNISKPILSEKSIVYKICKLCFRQLLL